ATIPFGDRVRVFDPCNYSRDTIGQLKDYYRLHDHLSDSVAYTDHYITGRWCRVAYGQDTGFVFNVYLSDLTFDATEPIFSYDNTGATTALDLLLIYPGAGCGGQIYSPSVYQFYGVYDLGDHRNELRAIEISYLGITDDLPGTLITTEDNRGLRFIIASRHPLQPHTFTGDYFEQPAFVHANPAHEHNHEEHGHVDRPLPAAITYDTSHHYGYPLINQVVLAVGSNRQVLEGKAFAYEIQLRGHGDIDGDGHPDYLIYYAEDMSSHVTLYLSSHAGQGELVGRATTAWFSCCC
ncbi:MAG: hypothetical protein AAFN92_20460, partial [Bacteroidota bacterium]